MYRIHSFNFRLITFAGNPNVSLYTMFSQQKSLDHFLFVFSLVILIDDNGVVCKVFVSWFSFSHPFEHDHKEKDDDKECQTTCHEPKGPVDEREGLVPA